MVYYTLFGVLHEAFYYIPHFALGNLSCAANNSNSIKRSTVEIFDHPLAHYDVIWQIRPYVIGPHKM